MRNKYKLSHLLVPRDSDLSFFDPEKFRVYKFNEGGYVLLKLLTSMGDFGAWEEHVVSQNLATRDQAECFVKKCEKNGIIVPHNG